MIRCRRGFFRADIVPLRQSFLWIIDYRRGGGRHDNGEWEDIHFHKAFAQLMRWMTDIEHWNAIFLLLAGVQCTPKFIVKLDLPEDCTHLRRCWSFKSIPGNYLFTCKEGGHVVREVEALSDIIVCLKHPVRTSIAPNLGADSGTLPLAFSDLRGEARQPS